MTFGFKERNSLENCAALNWEMRNGWQVIDVPTIAARAFARSAISDALARERPIIATRKEISGTWESPKTTPRAIEPVPITIISADFNSLSPQGMNACEFADAHR